MKKPMLLEEGIGGVCVSEVKGEIVEVLVKDGQLVEYGQPLFLVKAE